MSEDHLNDISLQDTMIELNIVLCLAAILNRQVLPDEELQHFDNLSAFMRARGVSLVEASQATAVPVTRGVIVIMLGGYLYNWLEKGADAALVLPDPDEFAAMTTSQTAPQHDPLPLVIKAIRALAFARAFDDREHWVEAGEIMLELAKIILFNSDGDTELGVQVALATHDLLSALGHEGAGLAQMIAYRLLVWSKRLPFLADLAPRKFPPPIAPRFASGDQLQLSLMFLQKGILDQPLDLAVTAHEMVEDADTVIRNSVEVEIGGTRESLKFEVAFGPALLAWALDDDSVESREFGAHADMKLRAMLDLCCKNRELLERHRDEELCDIYIMAYVGTGPAPDDRLGLALKIEMIDSLIHCIVGLSEEDVRSRESYSQAAGAHEAGLMAHIGAAMRAGR